MKKLLILLGLLLASPAFAVDNTVIVTPGTGITMRSKDVGSGVESMIHILGDTSGNPIYGTAGTANANILTVQGIAAMTPLLATVTGTVAATQSGTWNVTNISGTISLPTGAATAANQGTTADAPCTLPASATACSEIAVQKAIANAANGSIPAGSAIIGKVTTDQTTHGTTDLVAADITKIAGVAAVADPCQTAVKVYTPVNVVTATNVIITAVSAKKKYICGIFLYPGGTDNIAVYQATTATSCATAAADIFGGHTAATGFLATATAGFVVGNGASAIAATNTVNTDICITTSAAVQLSGVVVTVDQ
jgi:hypothetical protein